MDEAKKEQMGGRKKPTSEWQKLDKKMYTDGRDGDPNYKLGQAMKAAKKIYRKSRKSTSKMPNNSMARSNRRSSQTRKGRSSNRRSIMTID